MRSVLFFLVVASVGGWAALRQVPSTEARPLQTALAAPVAQPALVLPDRPSPATASVQVLGVSLDGRHLPMSELRGLLATQRGAVLDADLLEHDRAEIVAALVRRGHLAATARPAIVTEASDGAWITFEADKGPMFRLRTVTLTGANPRDAGVVTLSTGEVASYERIERARQTLADTLARHGKPSTVTATTRIDRDATALDVELTITASLATARR